MTPKSEDVMGDGAEKSPSEGIEIVEKNYYLRPKLERLREPEECAAFSNLSITPCLSINSTLTVLFPHHCCYFELHPASSKRIIITTIKATTSPTSSKGH